MSHPFQSHRQGKVEHSRAAKLTKGYASGGSVHSDEAEDKALIKKTVKKAALRASGGSVTARSDRPHRAKGGRVKPVTVNVVVAPQGGKDESGLAGAPPMMPPPGPPPGGPPMPPPGAGGPPPGGPPMPPPIRSSGGRAYKSGGRVKRADGGEVEENKLPYEYDPLVRAFGPIGQVRVVGRALKKAKQQGIDWLKENMPKPARPTSKESGYKRGVS